MAIVFGCVPSTIDGSEHIFSRSEGQKLPSKYGYKQYLPKIVNQEDRPICVPCSVGAYLNWRENLSTGSKKDNKIDYEEIYSSKVIEGEGMTFKEAFSYLRHHGVKSKLGNLTISEYAMVKNEYLLKLAIFMNGPCVGALPVYNFSKEFWKKQEGDVFQGYHAISIVGYDSNGFIIRNSWGTSFGDAGYTKISNEDLKKFVEIWTVLE